MKGPAPTQTERAHIWPTGTIPWPTGHRGRPLTDTDVMDPYLPEELFHPMTGEWIGRGPRPEPAPALWAQIWGIEWPPAEECESGAALDLSSDLFQFEAACFGIGAAIGIPRGYLSGVYCGVVAIAWARLARHRYGFD